MNQFSEAMLVDYPLTPDSTILEIGGYHGKWAREMHRRYGCKVWIFEPCFEFFEILHAEFAGNPKIKLHHLAVGGDEWMLRNIKIKGDMTGFDAEGPEETVAVMPITLVATLHYDVIQINCEGSEYEILGNVIQGWPKFLQVQFHHVGGYDRHDMRHIIDRVSPNYSEHIYDENSHWALWRK